MNKTESYPDYPIDQTWQQFADKLTPFSPLGQNRIRNAYRLAEQWHEGQTRESGERFFEHSLAVALILLEECKIDDSDIVIAALLQDAVENMPLGKVDKSIPHEKYTETVESILIKHVGRRPSEMIIAITKPKTVRGAIADKEKTQAEYIRQLETAGPDTILLKMADRLHNLRTLPAKATANRARTMAETVNDYFPLFDKVYDKYPQEGTYLKTQIEEAIQTISFTALKQEG